MTIERMRFFNQNIVDGILGIYKVNDIQASSYIELPEKYKNNISIINIKNPDHLCFLRCVSAYLYPVEDHKNRTSNYSRYLNKLNLKGFEFPMKVTDIPKFEKLNSLNKNVIELTGTVLKPIHLNRNYDQPQIDLIMYENHYCVLTNLHCLTKKFTYEPYM